jgi:Glu-tRNA(Gln) amidotransferase subunit E-like FAD-binding protein
MYPETDLYPILLTDGMLKEAEENAPDLERVMSELVSQLGSKDLAERLMLSPRFAVYKSITSELDVDKTFVANTLLQKFTELKRAGFDTDSIPRPQLAEMFREYLGGKITKQAVDEVLKSLSRGASDVRKVIAENKLGRITGKKLEELVESERKAEKKPLPKEAMLRNIMAKYRLNVDGAELKQAIDRTG